MMDPEMQAAVAELQHLILTRFPSTVFTRVEPAFRRYRRAMSGAGDIETLPIVTKRYRFAASHARNDIAGAIRTPVR